jgi:PAS domain S-box-containing protein
MIAKSVLATVAPARRLGLVAGLIALFLMVVTALYWWQITVSAQRLRQETLSEADLRGRQIVSAAADEVSLLFRSVDASTRELAALYVAGDARSFARKAKEIEDRLPSGSVLQVAVVDADGYIAHSTLNDAQRTFLGDREHIKVHRENEADRLFVSKPLLGRVSKQWTIQFTRPARRNGSLIGVAVISIAPAYLGNAVAAITLGSNDSVAVFRQSGEYLARNLDHESSLGKSAPPDRPFIGANAPDTGLMRIVSSFDKTPRIYRWQRLRDYPITVVVGLSEDSVLAPAERIIALDRRNAVMGTALLWLFAVAIAVLFRNLIKQQQLVFERSAQLRATLNTTPNVAIQWFGEDGRITYWNSASERTFGWTAAEAVGKTLEDLEITLDQAPDHRAALAAIRRTGQPVGPVESRFRSKEGRHGWLLSTAFAIPTEGGRLGFVGMEVDITERKQAEDSLSRLNLELEQRVSERTAQLEAASKELADFSYSVSHDLRSPLRAVAGFAKILEDDCGPSLGEEGLRLVRAIQDAGVRMGRLVDGLLDYLGLSRTTIQACRLDMNLLAAEAYGQEAPADRKVAFELKELPAALGDAALIREALAKLLSNALRFSRTKEAARIEVGGAAGEGQNTYYVRDNGIGFDMRYADKLFCVFERLHSEPELMGTGIGLAMVKRIVERHGGRVWAEATVGEGATFYFTLPSA